MKEHSMNTLLRIDSSARIQGSHSRDLGDVLENALRVRFAGLTVNRRDVAAQPVGHIENATITGMFTPPGQATEATRAALAQSDQLINEVKQADVVLLTVPMYNFGLPSSLKAWIDQVVRIGHTFAFDGQNFTGLLQGKKAYIVIAYGAGGYGAGEGFAAANFVEPYLKFILGFIGFKDITVFNVQGTNTNAAGMPASHAAITRDMQAAVAAIPAPSKTTSTDALALTA
jgi:FMN-dependent NADH-azoreductase